MSEPISVRRAINFDMNTKEMKAQKVYSKGYRAIKRFFLQNGFEHRQGSGYVSKDDLKADDVVDIMERMMKEMPWLKTCTRKIDLTDVQQELDLTQLVVGSDANSLRNSLTARRQKPSPELAAADEGKANDTVAGLRQFEKDVAAGKKQVNLRNGVVKDTGKGKGR